jgi:hypothetical protein
LIDKDLLPLDQIAQCQETDQELRLLFKSKESAHEFYSQVQDISTNLHDAVGKDITPERLPKSFKLATSSFVRMRWFTAPSKGWVRIESRNIEDRELVWHSLNGRRINGVTLGQRIPVVIKGNQRLIQSMVRED